AIVSENRLEWAVADYASLCTGAVTVPIYPTLSAPQIGDLLRDCSPKIVFVSTSELLQKIWTSGARPSIPSVVSFDPTVRQPEVMRLDTLYELGRQSTYEYPGEFQRSAAAVAPEQVATIIYTSGTTGTPKGAMLTHRNLVSNILATCDRLPVNPNDLSMSFLPLSHIFQRHVDYATFYVGATIAYPGSALTIAEDMEQIHPTFAAGVPRFFEKIYARILTEVSQEPSVVRRFFDKAVRVGMDHLRTGRRRLAYRVVDRIVFEKIRARLGGRIRFFI